LERGDFARRGIKLESIQMSFVSTAGVVIVTMHVAE